jgi:uroporphyrin-III C-methyltransferase/precorrin-2 dehydrogenase/sirohydrochlorin ferrochelatase
MHYYPVLLDLARRSCVVVGGGAIAEGKVGPLVAAGARVTVIAPTLSAGLAAQHRAGRFAHLARPYQRGDLAGTFLVIGATDDRDVNHAVHAEAVEAGALINVVDDVPYCGFILPSVFRRGDLIVTVSSSGHAPALAVRLRERFERELGDEYGRFLEIAARIRTPLSRAVPEFSRRKSIWYRLVDSDVLALLRAGEERRARDRIAEITGLDRAELADGDGERGVEWHPLPAAARTGEPGTVYLVGAGPGEPKLVTVRGLEVLRQADVVVYDRLVNPALLEEARPGAELVYVGKAPGAPCPTQDGINTLLVHAARQGRTVVRLKGGDPFVFGRGAEEALHCVEMGIPVEVIPGVSSILGATASAGIPLTARGYSGAFAVVTAHRAGDAAETDWAAVASVETLVIVMGVERLADIVAQLVAHGRAPDTPAAIVENGTLPSQRVVMAALGGLVDAATAAAVRAPALVIIGQVVELRSRLAGDVETAEAGAGGGAFQGERHVA